jgi:hypothetical protein
MAVGSIVGGSLPASILTLAVGATSTSTAVFILHLSLVSPLQSGVVKLSYPRGIDLVYNIIRGERERLRCKN